MCDGNYVSFVHGDFESLHVYKQLLMNTLGKILEYFRSNIKLGLSLEKFSVNKHIDTNRSTIP